jgi:hypothetical protein
VRAASPTPAKDLSPGPALRDASTLSPRSRVWKLLGRPPSSCKKTLLCALCGMEGLNTEVTKVLRALCAKALEAQRTQRGRWQSSTLIDVITDTAWRAFAPPTITTSQPVFNPSASSCDKLVAPMKNGAKQIRKTNISLWAGSPAARQTESAQDHAGLRVR